MFTVNNKGPRDTVQSLFSYNDSEEKENLENAENRDLKLREKLLRDAPELADLRQKLHQAYINKEISLHMAEKEAEKIEQQIMDTYYNEQSQLSNTKAVLEDEDNASMLNRRKLEYRQDLERQMAEVAEYKKEQKYQQYKQEQKVSHDQMERIAQEDQKLLEEKINKKLRLRQEMEEDLKRRADIKEREKQKKKEDDEKLQSYWANTYQHENDAKHSIEDRRNQITERQEECGRNLQEINNRNQVRSQLVESITHLSELLEKDDSEKSYDNEEVKKSDQEKICSDLDTQCAGNVRGKLEEKKRNDNLNHQEQWIWGDSVQTRDQAEKHLQDEKDVSNYNKKAMLEHQLQERLDHFGRSEFADASAQEQARRNLSEEEREIALKSEHE